MLGVLLHAHLHSQYDYWDLRSVWPPRLKTREIETSRRKQTYSKPVLKIKGFVFTADLYLRGFRSMKNFYGRKEVQWDNGQEIPAGCWSSSPELCFCSMSFLNQMIRPCPPGTNICIFLVDNTLLARHGDSMPVIPGTQEAEGLQVRGQPH